MSREYAVGGPFGVTYVSVADETRDYMVNTAYVSTTVAAPAGPVTIYTPAPALNTNDNNANTNFRVLVQLALASNGSLQVRFRASGGGVDVLEIYGASFGKWDGATIGTATCRMTTTPFRLTFGGGNSTTVANNSTVTSDLIAHPGVTLSAGDWVIVAYYNQNAGSAQSGQRYSSGHTTATTCFHAEGSLNDLSQNQDVSGFSIVANVQPGGSGGYNFSVDLLETSGGGAARVPGMKVRIGAAWVEKPVKVWSGSAWVQKPVKYWSGSAWTATEA